jgi:hypothetical protein
MTHALDHPLLTYAIERENWELAALCLVVAAAESLGWLPPDTIDSILEVVAEPPPPRRRRGRCRERRR